MERQDQLMMGFFGVFLLGGGLAQTYIADKLMRDLLTGMLYVVFIGAMFLTEYIAQNQAVRHGHMHIDCRDPDSGQAHHMDLYFSGAEPVLNYFDPSGQYPHAYKVWLARPQKFPIFGKIKDAVFMCLQREWDENFHFQPTVGKTAEWMGIRVKHWGSETCEADLFVLPQSILLQDKPMLQIHNTNRDAERRALILKDLADVVAGIPEASIEQPAGGTPIPPARETVN